MQPDATAIAAGLSPAVGVDAPPNFLNDMYINGAKGYFDAIGMYLVVSPAASSRTRAVRSARVHDIMTLNGDGDKKVGLTEFGAPMSALSADGVSQQNRPSRSPTCWPGRRPPAGAGPR